MRFRHRRVPAKRRSAGPEQRGHGAAVHRWNGSSTQLETQRTSKKMKTTTINKIVSTILFAGVCELGLAFVPPAINLANAQQAANAATEPTPKVVEISAKKFEFTPAQITLKKGEPVILRLSSSDRVHGFMSKPLKIDTDIPA